MLPPTPGALGGSPRAGNLPYLYMIVHARGSTHCIRFHVFLVTPKLTVVEPELPYLCMTAHVMENTPASTYCRCIAAHVFELQLAARHGERRALLEEGPEVLDALVEGVALAPDLDGLGLLQRRQLLAPVEHLLLQALRGANGRAQGRERGAGSASC